MIYKTIKLLFLLFTITLFQSCEQDGFIITDSGLQYKFVIEGEGVAPEDGNILVMNVSYVDAPGNIIFTSTQSGSPMAISYYDSVLSRDGGLEEGIRMLAKGDSLIMKFPIENLYENTFNLTLPDSLVRGTDVTVYIGVQDVFTREEFGVYRMRMMEQQQKTFLEIEAKQLEEDGKMIDAYLNEKNIDAEIDPSGLRYVIIEEGEGDFPQPNQQVSVNYTGKLLNGQVFDTSVEADAREADMYNANRPYQPYQFALGTGSVIQGWDIGIGLLKRGGKGVLYIPSTLAYGERATGSIPKNAILVFDVELLDILN